jgi:alpha-amylase
MEPRSFPGSAVNDVAGRRRRRAVLPIALALAASTSACGGNGPSGPGGGGGTTTRPTLPQTYRATGRGASGDVFVHLFEWKWNDIATECETVLGPAGWAAVQVSPPQEHAVLANFPWWQRYQPVSYSLDRSRSGTAAEFASMVTRCGSAGVDIYVDAVINHMTAGAGTGSDGTVYTKYEYPGLYTQADFHAPCGITNWNSVAQVQDCELLGLSDLNTGSSAVRQKIAGYLMSLVRLGVDGFRVDAAKHMQPVELDSIVTLVNRAAVDEGFGRPYWFLEVIDYGGEAVKRTDYTGVGWHSGGASDITEFKFRGIGDKFINLGTQRVSDLNPGGPEGRRFSESAWGLMPADKAVVFVENHDTQRDGGIWFRDGQVHRLANVFMLAQPYGYPSVMSSYAFNRGTPGRDAGPPSDGGGNTSAVACATSFETAAIGQWVCEHRDRYIAGMVGFRSEVAGAPIANWWDNGGNAVAFARGDEGFVAINRESTEISRPFTTGLPAGSYCDVLTGTRMGPACSGLTVVVNADGSAQLTLAPLTAVAIHAGMKL